MTLGADKRQGSRATFPQHRTSLRTILLVLALVPSIALVSLWAVNSARLYGNWKSSNDRINEGGRLAPPITAVLVQLQTERQLSAVALAGPGRGASGLAKQRNRTDKAVHDLRTLSGTLPNGFTEDFRQLGLSLDRLPEYRETVDRRESDQQRTFDDYNGVIASDMDLFQDLTSVGLDQVSVLAGPAIDAQWGMEMLSRESAIMAAGTVSGHLSAAQRSQLAGVIGSQQHVYQDKVLPRLPVAYQKTYRKALSGTAWKQKTRSEQAVLTSGNSAKDGLTPVREQVGKEWQQSYSAVSGQLTLAGAVYAKALVSNTQDSLHGLMRELIVNSTMGAVAVIVVLLISVILTSVLRRRIFALRTAALELQTRLPDVVERLRKGATVDTDSELPEVDYGNDELGMLGQALNQARSSALETAVREVEQYRGFERLLQRIARRTQLLIGMQMKRLGEMQRRHEDPEVLEGLFDVDHLATRLRRYEENLVILGGGQPQRRWRKPVLLLDVLRSAQGEVQDYRRIRIDTDGETWLSGRAVGPVVHIMAELMENAVTFSKPPSPVEVSVSAVGRGVAVEVEDRGMGMDPDQYAEANELMADPPHMDVMSRNDDARLGLYVVARLSANLGLKVELRPSAFGGTRVVVLVPRELIAEDAPRTERPHGSDRDGLTAFHASDPGQDHGPHVFGPEPQRPPFPGNQEMPTRPLVGPWAQPPAGGAVPTVAMTGSGPLPRRVRQASLAAELREPPRGYAEAPRTASPEASLPRRTASRRSGATVGAFQRQSRMARLGSDSDQPSVRPSPDPSPGHDRTRKEDRR
jgi:signal transduction histidine kinase